MTERSGAQFSVAEYLPISKLRLDPMNPRLAADLAAGASQIELAQHLADVEDALVVARSMANYGFYPWEVLVVVPDCGRDTNRLIAIPCQHHFGSRSSREIFALFVGPGIAAGVRVERKVDQIQVATTSGALMGFATDLAEGEALEEVLG